MMCSDWPIKLAVPTPYTLANNAPEKCETAGKRHYSLPQPWQFLPPTPSLECVPSCLFCLARSLLFLGDTLGYIPELRYSLPSHDKGVFVVSSLNQTCAIAASNLDTAPGGVSYLRALFARCCLWRWGRKHMMEIQGVLFV